MAMSEIVDGNLARRLGGFAIRDLPHSIFRKIFVAGALLPLVQSRLDT
jgi:hypothetical protein